MLSGWTGSGQAASGSPSRPDRGNGAPFQLHELSVRGVQHVDHPLQSRPGFVGLTKPGVGLTETEIRDC